MSKKHSKAKPASLFHHLAQSDPYWFAFWAIIYVSFIVLDVFFPQFVLGSSALKYLGIFLCVVYARHKYPRDYRLFFALLLTLCADTILVWTPFRATGVCVFVLAHICHLTRLNNLTFRQATTIAIIVANAIGLGALIGGTAMRLGAPVLAYVILLFSNLSVASRRQHAAPRDFSTRCAWYAFLLFVLCDFCVALRFGSDGLVFQISSLLVWVFYYPSQVLMANSHTAPRKNFAKKSAMG